MTKRPYSIVVESALLAAFQAAMLGALLYGLARLLAHLLSIGVSSSGAL